MIEPIINKFKIVVAVFLLLLAILSMVSCDITKSAAKSKTDTDITESIETSRKRAGDSVTFVPALRVKYKDTTIYTVNRQGTTLRTVYDKTGQVSQVDCYASVIEELIKENRRILETVKEKQKDKTEDINTDWILYGFITIGVVMIAGMILLYKRTKTL